MTDPVKAPKKLIEVALPLDAINQAAAREKSIRQGHPSTLHLWWARRPLAAARAVLFAQLVNDPSWRWELENPGKIPPAHLKASWAASRKRLFDLLSELVRWESTGNEDVLSRANAEILKSWRETCQFNDRHANAPDLFGADAPPGVHDPFAGGGAIPLEAQRLGLQATASDLNPVAVLINKAMIEIPPLFSGMPPVGPAETGQQEHGTTWLGARALAEDVRRYGKLMRDEAERRIGKLYPDAAIAPEMKEGRPDLRGYAGRKLKIIAWLWARSVKSPSPAFAQVSVPLTSTFILCTKAGREVWVEPVVKGGRYKLHVRTGSPPEQAKTGTKAGGRGAEFRCILSGAPISGDYIKAEAQAGRMGAVLLAVVAEGERGRVYLSPDESLLPSAAGLAPSWKPDIEFFPQALGFRVANYGMTRWSDIFTQRQLIALSTFCDLVSEIRERVEKDARRNGQFVNDERSLSDGGRGARAYADAIAIYLALGASRLANRSATLNFWDADGENIQQVFARQVLPIVWDFVEGNPFSSSTGNFEGQLDYLIQALEGVPANKPHGVAVQQDAAAQKLSDRKVVSTDPPYYDNVGYADLSDFFYVWQRRALRQILPQLFSTVATPKAEELVATPARHGGKKQAEQFFLNGMTRALGNLASQTHPAFPVTIFYAFKQSETDDAEGTSSTGWVAFLEAVIRAGFAITGTWPVRTEYTGNLKTKRNALASSVVLVCRRRPTGASQISRREFVRELSSTLPQALDEMTRGTGEDRSPVAPVDLSQAIIGPGMAVFSRYSSVLEADGSPMSVKTALQLINRFVGEDDFDADTQFCLHWFEQFGWSESLFGEADKLARAKATAVDGLKDAGVIFAARGKVRLRKWSDYPDEWDPRTDSRVPVWEALHQLVRVFKQEGESGAGKVLAAVQPKSEAIRQLAYRLYTLCERKGWAEDARAYNDLVAAWAAIESAAAAEPKRDEQLKLFGGAA